MSKFGSRARTGAVGTGASVTQNKRVVHNESKTEPMDYIPQEGETASVGLSVSFGFSHDFGKQKGDASAWVTLPCRPDAESIQETAQRCRQIAIAEAQSTMDELIDTYYPEGFTNG